MYRVDREQVSKVVQDIISAVKIRTQKEFQNEYNKRFPENYIALSTARRMMINAGISLDKETGYYVYHPEEKVTSVSVLKDILTLKSYGVHSLDEFYEPILISVNFGCEKAIASLIYDLWEDDVFVILGYGCLLIYCTKSNADIYSDVKNYLKS